MSRLARYVLAVCLLFLAAPAAFASVIDGSGQNTNGLPGHGPRVIARTKPQTPPTLPSPSPSIGRRRLQQAIMAAQTKAFANSIVADGATASKTPAVAQTLLAYLGQQDESTGTESVAGAFVAAAKQDVKAASLTYAQTALLAATGSEKQQRAFTKSAAMAFTLAQSQGDMESYVNTLAGAIQSSGDDRSAVVHSVGSAMADASATADGSAAVAEAVAVAICEGDGTATAVSEALAIAVTINPDGCATVSIAYAKATATCGPGFAESQSVAFTTTFTTCNFNPFSRGNGHNHRMRKLDRVKVCRFLFGNSRQLFFKCLGGGFSSEFLLQRLRSSRMNLNALLVDDFGNSNSNSNSNGNSGTNSNGNNGTNSNSNPGISALVGPSPTSLAITDPAPGAGDNSGSNGSGSTDNVGTITDPVLGRR